MPYLKTKLTNDICRILPKDELRFKLSNININGVKRGCSGHITHVPSGCCVYVNTEPLCGNPDRMMFRYAKDENDYSSNHPDFKAPNQFTGAQHLAICIAAALMHPDR